MEARRGPLIRERRRWRAGGAESVERGPLATLPPTAAVMRRNCSLPASEAARPGSMTPAVTAAASILRTRARRPGLSRMATTR
eukprot:3443250-Prymnesium_polylepis.1